MDAAEHARARADMDGRAGQRAHTEHGKNDPAHGVESRGPGSEGEREVQRRLGTQSQAERFYDDHMLDHLNERMREFVQRQEMFFLATADRDGECDSTFRAGPPGFLQVIDAHTLVFPEYRGNGVLASLGNIRENPRLGILLMDFLHARIGLHINGRATLVEDDELRLAHPHLPIDPVPGRRPLIWVRVEVREAYIHCAKHIPHLHKAPGHSERDWGTDDYKRKGGDFFGVARAARQRRWAAPDTGGVHTVPGQRSSALADEPAGPTPSDRPSDRPSPRPSTGPGRDGPERDGPEPAATEPAGAGADAPAERAAAPAPIEPQVRGTAAEPAVVGPVTRVDPEPEPVQRAAALADQADSAMWLEEAQRALEEAQRRGRAPRESTSFQGWFG